MLRSFGNLKPIAVCPSSQSRSENEEEAVVEADQVVSNWAPFFRAAGRDLAQQRHSASVPLKAVVAKVAAGLTVPQRRVA